MRNVPELVLHTRLLESERVVLSVPCEDVSNKTMVESLICQSQDQCGQPERRIHEPPHTQHHACVSSVGLRDPPHTQSRKERRRARARKQPYSTEYVFECMDSQVKPDGIADHVQRRMLDEIESVHIEGLCVNAVGNKIIFKVDRRMTKVMISFIDLAIMEYCQI